jgi:hypothetical protein
MLVTAMSIVPMALGANLSVDELEGRFHQQVDHRLEVPDADREAYEVLLVHSLETAGIAKLTPQFLLMIDRNPNVQAAMLFWSASDGRFRLVGASSASTGKPGRYEYFETPLGVFRHALGNPDFRAEGTRNKNGVLGYGPKGTRVYDFGWQIGRRGWGSRGFSLMRLQLHSTDPDMLEPRIGTAQSKGCIRIPLSLNRFIDHYGFLDADYERAVASGINMWMLAGDREPTPWSGRYLVIVDSGRTERPAWSPLPSRNAAQSSVERTAHR